MEQVKLTIDEFRKIKNKIINMLAEKEEDEDLEWDRDEEQEKIFLLKYKEAVEELLSYDLSEIPADEWNSEDRYLCTFDDLGINMSSLDFSKTKANIDVNIIYNVIDANDDNVSFKNCNVIFHDDRKFLASCFDEKTIEKNKNIFLSSNFSDELKDKFYNKKVSIEDYKNLTEEQIKEIKEKNFFSLNIPNIKLNNLESEKELYLKLLDITRYYSKEDAEGIIFILSKNINSLNDKKDIIINTVLKSNVEDIKSFALELFEEKLKDIIYIDDYYPDMIKNNYKDVFLIGKKLPNYAIEEYKRNHISLNTFQENYNELHNIRNIETHFDYYLEQINKIVGFEEIYELRKYPKFKEGYYLNSRYIKSNDVEVSIKEFIKEYATYIDNYDVLPNFIKVVDKIDDFRIIDLDKIDSNTLIKDKKQRHIFKTYQLLKTYISETEAENILEEIVNISGLDITKFDYQFLTELSKKSKKNEKTIDKVDFLASITQIINEQIEIYDILDNIIYETIINDGISYSDRMPDRFKKKHPDLFISDDIKFSVLKDSIYKRDITPVFLKNFSEYKEELKRINPMLLQHNLYIYTEDKTINLSQYIAKFFKEETYDFIVDYGTYLYETNNRSSNYFNKIDIDKLKTKEELKEHIQNYLYDRILNGSYYNEEMPQEFKQNHPDLFLPDKANDDLKEAFYKKNIKMHDLLNNSDNIDYLSKINPKVLLSKALKFSALDDVIYRFYKNDILDFIKKYGYCFEEAYYNYLIFDINQATKEEFENKMDEYIYYAITCGCKYNEIISDSIKTKHPELFLPKDIDKNIRDKFYDKNLTYEDLTANNNELLNKLIENNVDISYGFNKLKDIYNNYKWAPIDIRNKISLQLIELNYSIKDNAVSKIIFNYLKNNYDDLTKLKPDEINKLKEIVLLIINSNSAEVRNLKNSITKEVVNSENPKKTLEIIENVFIKNNLPTVGKTYTCFDLLHPNFNGFDINSKHSTISPVLKKCSPTKRSVVVFTDLIKSSFGSNNRSVNEYLNNLEKCNSMYENILSNKINIDSLTEEDIKELIKFTYHIETMYNNSQLGKDNKYHKDINKDNCIEVITDLKLLLSPNNSLDYKLSDRIIKMFCHFSGLDTVDEVKQYIKTKISQREEKSIELSKEGKIPLEKGDLVKGLNDIKYIGSILQNGSVAKEYLGAESTSDSTPLDTDVSMILSEGSTYQKLSATNANGYGPIWVVLKNDDRFITTRDSDGEKNVKDYKLGKLELFKTGVLGEDHYGIRTGFASSDIDCFICESDDDKLAVEIAMNGFYTPIADMTGKITFTYEDYKQMVEKMNGLSYYGKSEFIVDESVHKEDQIINKIVSELPDNKKLTEHKAELIKKKLEEVLEKQGIKLVDKINLEPKTAVLFNTGSTGRNTNLPGDGDFDYTMQIDNEIFIDRIKLEKLREAIVDAFKPISGRFNDDIRDLETILTDENGKEFKLKIDITFTAKTDKVEYASDVCVVDRLNSIKDPKDREIVKANIIFAKKFLKSIEAYKAARADSSQGGMGGIGVENWILQNGGSFYKAAKTFVEAAEKSTNFTEFKKIYFLPNFGHNHMAYKKDFYPHDDYIKDNMNENGYEKMVGALKEYIRKYEADEKISLSEYEIDKKKTIGQNKYRDEESLLEDIKLLLSERNPNPVLTKANLGETGFMYLYEENGNKYLIKPGVNKKDIKTRPTRVEVQDIASKLQKIITPESCVDITVIGEGKLKIAMQPKFETVPCSDIIKEHANELLGEYIVDYLLGNFDSAMDNFIVDKDNILRGIDKEQGLKYTMMEEESAVSLKLDMSYKPRNSKGTIYPELFRRYVNGEIELDLNFLYSSVEKLKMISDVDYLKLYKGYINAYGPEKIDEKYNQILSRKKYLEKNLEKFLDGLVTEREIKAGFKM